MGIQDILEIEYRLIYEKLQSDCNRLFITEDGVVKKEIVTDIHRYVVDNLIYSYFYAIDKYSADYLANKILCNTHQGKFEYYIFENPQDIINVCETIHTAYLNSSYIFRNGELQRIKSKQMCFETGSVYTQNTIAYNIVFNTINNWISEHGDISGGFKILDFACGTGRFYKQCIKVLNQKGLSVEETILNRCYAVDVDDIAIGITRLFAVSRIGKTDKDILDKIIGNIVNKDILIADNLLNNTVFSEKFDCIVSNPPYLVLKSDNRKTDKQQAERLKSMVSYFKNSGFYFYSIEGMLNLYKISIEKILSLVKDKGEIGIICPSTLFADKSATKLRKYLLLQNNLRHIKYYGESANLFDDVKQATAIFYLQTKNPTDCIEIENNGKKFKVDITQIKMLFGNSCEIPTISNTDWEILKKINKFKKLKDIANVRNKRGELDLTIYKNYITTSKTKYRLVRGNMLKTDNIEDINNEYVLDAFPTTKSEEYIYNDFNRKRLVCQQISNIALKRRINFIFCNENDILGNSCNYLSSDVHTLNKLKILFDSDILDWRFSLTSSNNHINNYELAELPIIDLNLVDEKFLGAEKDVINNYVGLLYGLSKTEIEYIAYSRR